jgi:fumarate reductase flavoprotein subunit
VAFAIARIPLAIYQKQTLSIDVVSGATFTSNAILAAVEDCARQAGGDEAVAALKQ